MDFSKECLAFVKFTGINTESLNTYDFLFTTEPDTVWGENWEQPVAGICGDLTPKDTTFNLIRSIATDLTLSTAEKQTCFSMMDSVDGIIPMAWEDIDGYDEYPPEGRLILRFGDTYDQVKEKLAKKNISFLGESLENEA